MENLNFTFRNDSKNTVVIFIEPWAASIPILPGTKAEVSCRDIDEAVELGIVDDCFVIWAGLNILVRCDGQDHEFKDSD